MAKSGKVKNFHADTKSGNGDSLPNINTVFNSAIPWGEKKLSFLAPGSPKFCSSTLAIS